MRHDSATVSLKMICPKKTVLPQTLNTVPMADAAFSGSQVHSAWRLVRDSQVVKSVVMARVPDGVRELCDGCFMGCSSLHRVTVGPSSTLERIGVEAIGAVH